MDIIEAIKERRSVRSYNGENISAIQHRELMQIIEKAMAPDDTGSPFDGQLTIRLKSFDLKEGFSPSTYGMIKGAGDFFLLGFGDGDENALNAGFRFEKVVLKAWEIGLGTCWIAATFKGTDFEKGESWPDGQRLKIVSPVGVASKKSLVEKIARMGARSDKRKPFSQLFFNRNFNTPLNEDSQYAESLRMLRLAPSATNSQPWRALVNEDCVDFYFIKKSDWSPVDLGIGICHFVEGEKYHGFKGEFFHKENPEIPPTRGRYVISYRRI